MGVAKKPDAHKTVGGYIVSAGTGFLTGFGFGVAGSTASNTLKSTLNMSPIGRSLLANHTIGGMEGAANQVIRPDGASLESIVPAAGLGFLQGADGPTVGPRRAG